MGRLSIQILVVASFALLVVGCNSGNQNTEVKYSGALRSMMSGDLQATASLDSLSKKPHLYALGAFENLKGEIQIFEGMAFNSTVQSGNLVFDKTFDKKASLIVYAEISSWQNIEIPSAIDSSKKLETFIEKQANQLGIVFLLANLLARNLLSPITMIYFFPDLRTVIG